MSICNNLFRLTQALTAVKISSSNYQFYLSKFCLQLLCQGNQVKLPMTRALHLRVARPRLKPQGKLGFWEILMFSQIVAHLDENIVSNCLNVCVFTNDVRQSPQFYLVQHSPSEWPNNNKNKEFVETFHTTPYIWSSSVTIEEPISVHQGFELNRNWV